MTTKLTIEIPDDLAEFSQALREDLLLLDVLSVSPMAGGPPPEHSRAGVTEIASVLLVVLPISVPLVRSTVRVVEAWLTRSGKRSVVLEVDGKRLELLAANNSQQRRAVDAWVAAVTGGEGELTTADDEDE